MIALLNTSIIPISCFIKKCILLNTSFNNIVTSYTFVDLVNYINLLVSLFSCSTILDTLLFN